MRALTARCLVPLFLAVALVAAICAGSLLCAVAGAETPAEPEAAAVAGDADSVAETSAAPAEGQEGRQAAPETPAVVMPDVVGMNYADAGEMLHVMGIRNVEVVKRVDGQDVRFNQFGVINPHNWTVAAQSVPRGTELAEGDPVVLSLARTGIGVVGMDIADILGRFGL